MYFHSQEPDFFAFKCARANGYTGQKYIAISNNTTRNRETRLLSSHILYIYVCMIGNLCIRSAKYMTVEIVTVIL